MDDQRIYKKIKSTVHSFLPDAQVLLFGSRARGRYDRFSDFDLLIITKESFTAKEKTNWLSTLDKALVKSLKAPVDVLLNSKEEVNKKKDLPGHIIRWAVKEGIEL